MTTLEESTAVTREQKARLPKKVQARLYYLEGQVEYLNDRIATILAERDGTIPDTNVRVSSVGYNATYADAPLPKDASIDFYLAGSRQKYRNMITVNHVHSRAVLRIASSNGISITPVASNVIEVGVDER
jgi:hypothetical protein